MKSLCNVQWAYIYCNYKLKEVITFNPDGVYNEFAVNDACKLYNISVDENRENLKSMILTLENANPKDEIILQTMSLVIDMSELNMLEATKRSDLLEYLKMYPQVAKERNLMLIDHYPNWDMCLKNEVRDTYFRNATDGIHPNLEGHKKILLSELQKTLNQ